MRWVPRIVLTFMLCALPAAAQQASAKRIALVIGNAAYTTPGWELRNPVNDATLMAERLKPLGFEVIP